MKIRSRYYFYLLFISYLFQLNTHTYTPIFPPICSSVGIQISQPFQRGYLRHQSLTRTTLIDWRRWPQI